MRFKAKNGAIREKIASIRANQITGTTSDFKMGVLKTGPRVSRGFLYVSYPPRIEL